MGSPSNQNVQFSLDAGPTLDKMRQIVAAFLKINEASIKTVEGFVHLEQVGNQLIQVWDKIRVTTEQGTKAMLAYDDAGKLVNETTKLSTRELEKYNAKLAKQAELERLAAQAAKSRKEAEATTKAIRYGVDTGPATNAEKLAFDAATRAREDFQAQNNITKATVGQIYRELTSGIVKNYRGAHAQIQLLIQAEIDAHAKLGNSARKEYDRLLTRAAKTYEEIRRKAQRELEAEIKLWNRKQEAIMRAGAALERQKNQQIASIESQLRRDIAALDQARNSANEYIFTWRGLARLAAVQLAHQAISSMTSAMREGVNEAIKLQVAIAEVMTIDTSQSSFSAWAATIREASDIWGIDLADQIEAAYEALSNQIVKSPAEFRLFAEEVNKFAVTTKSSAADSLNLLSSALNAFGLTADRTTEIAETFFKAIDLGRFRAQDVANSLGNVLVPAQQLGVSYQEVAATLALMTIRGIKASEAQTLLRNIFQKLIRPSEEMKRFFEEIGVATGEAAIQTYGFTGVMKLIEERTQGSTAELGELFQRIRAITGALVFAGDGLNEYNTILEKVSNSTEQYNRAAETVLENTGKKLQVEFNQIANFFKADFGFGILDTITNLVVPIEDLSDYVKQLATEFLNLAEVAGVLGALYLGKQLLSPLYQLGTLFLEARRAGAAYQAVVRSTIIAEAELAAVRNNLILATVNYNAAEAALGATLRSGFIIGAIYVAIKVFNEYVNSLDNTVRESQESFSKWSEAITRAGKIQQDEFNRISDAYRKAQADINHVYDQIIADTVAKSNKIINEETKQYEIQEDLLKTYYKNLEKTIKDIIKEWEKGIDEIDKTIEKLEKKIKSLSDTQEENLFTWLLKGISDNKTLTDTQKFEQTVGEITKRINDLQSRADYQISIGNTDEAQRILDIVVDLAKKIVDLNQEAETKNIFSADTQSAIATYSDILTDVQSKMQDMIVLQEISKIKSQQAVEQQQRELELVAERKRLIEDFSLKDALAIEDIPDFLTTMTEQLQKLQDLQIKQQTYNAPQKEIDETTKQIDTLIKIGNAQYNKLQAQELQNEANKLRNEITKQQEYLDAALLQTAGAAQAKQFVTRQIQDVFDNIKEISFQELKAKNPYTGQEETLLLPKEEFRGTLEQLANVEKIIAKNGLTSQESILAVQHMLEALFQEFTNNTGAINTGQFEQATQRLLSTLADLATKINVPTEDVNRVLQEQAATKASLQAIENQIVSQFGANTNATTGLTTAIQTQTSTYQTYTTQLILALQENTAALQRPGFASGGYTDTVPAMLTPGEFVVNRNSTRQFYTQLSAMNSGLRPQGYASGGEVTNVGGINVTVNESKSPTQTAKQVVTELNRAIRQGAIRIRK